MRLGLFGTVVLLAAAGTARAADEPVKLSIKPLLCVLDKSATSWKSIQANEYCLNDTLAPAPRICWGSASSGETTEKREVKEEFTYWIGLPAGTEHLAEVKISVLRVGSTDRRRERRARHVWDVL
jgi:hypothetical protein